MSFWKRLWKDNNRVRADETLAGLTSKDRERLGASAEAMLDACRAELGQRMEGVLAQVQTRCDEETRRLLADVQEAFARKGPEYLERAAHHSAVELATEAVDKLRRQVILSMHPGGELYLLCLRRFQEECVKQAVEKTIVLAPEVMGQLRIDILDRASKKSS